MGTLSDISSVQIALNTASVPKGTFGIQLIASPHASFSELVRTYTSMDSTKDDNLPPLVLRALSDGFSQIPHPDKIKVGRMSVAKVAIAPVDAVALAVYSLNLGATLVSVTAAASPTTSTIATQLATAINTAALGVTATAVAGIVELVFTGAIVPVTKFTKIQWDVITKSVTVGIVATDLTAISDADAGWYALHITSRAKQDILDAAAWTEARTKLFVCASADADILTPGVTTDVIDTLRLTNYFRTAISYHGAAATQYADSAWASRVLTIQPGGETWALKRLGGVTSDNLTATQRGTIITAGGNTFETYAPTLLLTGPGRTSAGEWIDVIRFRDWLQDNIQKNMVNLMINRDKVPYTDSGIQLLAANLRASLKQGQSVGGIAPDEVDAAGNKLPGFVITVPLSADIDDATKSSRIVYFKFSARLAGAIHMTNITGALSYSF